MTKRSKRAKKLICKLGFALARIIWHDATREEVQMYRLHLSELDFMLKAKEDSYERKEV